MADPQIPILVTFGGKERGSGRPVVGSFLMLARHPVDAEPFSREIVGRMIAAPFYYDQQVVSLLPLVQAQLIVGTDGQEYRVEVVVQVATDADRALLTRRMEDPFLDER